MTSIDLIKNKLPQELRDLAQSFNIPEKFLEKEPNLIILVLKSKSVDKNEEKQNWFNLLSIMNDEQVNRLRDILNREKQKLEEIENKYDKQKEEIKKKYENRFETISYQNKIDKLEEVESSHKEKDDKDAENLLNQI